MSLKTTLAFSEFSTTFPLFYGTGVLNIALVSRRVTITVNFHLCGDEVVEAVAFCQVFAQDHPLSTLAFSRPTDPEQCVRITALWKHQSHSVSNNTQIITTNKNHWKCCNELIHVSCRHASGLSFDMQLVSNHIKS